MGFHPDLHRRLDQLIGELIDERVNATVNLVSDHPDSVANCAGRAVSRSWSRYAPALNDFKRQDRRTNLGA